MKNVIFYLLFIVIACENTNKDSNSKNNSLSNPINLTDTNKKQQNVIKPNNCRDDINLENDTNRLQYLYETSSIKNSKITELPFGSEDWPNDNKGFYSGIVCKDVDVKMPIYSKTYPLPPITKYKYVNIEDTSNHDLCRNGKAIDSICKIERYRIRLRDFGNLKVFYMSSIFTVTKWDLPVTCIQCCDNNIPLSFGYLILYESKEKFATIIKIYSEDHGDYSYTRNFYIDKDYTIHVRDYAFTDGGLDENDNVIAEGGLYASYTIKILNNYAIKISKNK